MDTVEFRADRVAGTVRRAALPLAAGVVLLAVVLGQLASVAAVARAEPWLFRTTATVVHSESAVIAQWTDRAGRSHVGPLAIGRRGVGDTRGIWVDDAGRPASPSTGGPAAMAVGVAVLAAGGTALGAATLLAPAWACRRRHRLLAREWAEVEARWSGRATERRTA